MIFYEENKEGKFLVLNNYKYIFLIFCVFILNLLLFFFLNSCRFLFLLSRIGLVLLVFLNSLNCILVDVLVFGLFLVLNVI